MQALPTIAALRDGIPERIDNEVIQFVIPYCHGWNRLELIAKIFSVGDSAIYRDDNMVSLYKYRIVVAFPV